MIDNYLQETKLDNIEDEPMYPGSDEEFDTLDDEMEDEYW